MKTLINKYFGPSTLIAAAFIGPGTVTICTLAGAQFGYSLIWALVFSILATIYLQNMASKIALVTGQGLSSILGHHLRRGFTSFLMMSLIISSVIIGNAAYEAGNISGAILGLGLVFQNKLFSIAIIFTIAFILLWQEQYKWIERIMIALISLMSMSFLVCLIFTKIDWQAFWIGIIPRFPSEENLLLTIGIIGTTIVPYNLFLHASTVRKKYNAPSQIAQMKTENTVSIILGGLVSIAIILLSASTLFGSDIEVTSAKEIALQLQPQLGALSNYAIGIGLFAAGLSSAITAPYAASLVAKEVFSWNNESDKNKIRGIWMFILVIGCIFSLRNIKPIIIIKFAQVTNGIILPIMVVVLIYISNQKKLMGSYTNNLYQNITAAVVFVISLIISIKTLIVVLQ